MIRGGKLHVIEADEPYQFSTGDQFGIVSDAYVKWRGGKIPSGEEEPKVCSGQSQRSHWSTANKCSCGYICVHVSVSAMCRSLACTVQLRLQPTPLFLKCALDMKLLCVSNSSICCFAGAWRYISSVPHCHRPTWCAGRVIGSQPLVSCRSWSRVLLLAMTSL